MKRPRHEKKKQLGLAEPSAGKAADLIARIRNLDPSEAAGEITDALTASQVIEGLPSDYQQAQELITALYKRFPEKAVAKAARKAAFRLREKGVSLETIGLGTESRQNESKYKDAFQAFMGPVFDLDGTRVVLVLRDSPIRGLDLGMGMASRRDGLRDFAFTPVSRKGFAPIFESVNNSLGPLIEVEMPVMVRILEDAFAVGEHGRTVPVSYGSLRLKLLGAAPPVDDPFKELRSLAAKEDVTISEKDAGRLFSFPPLNQWMPALEALERCEAEMESVLNSPLVLSQQSKEERERRLRTDMAAAIFDEDARMLIKEILYETAYYFGRTKGEDTPEALARRAAYTMEKTPAGSTNPVLDLLIKRGIDELKDPVEAQGAEDPDAGRSNLLIMP